MLARLSTVTPPAQLPINLYLARKHCRIDNADDDDLLTIYMQTATNLAETFLNRALITQTLEWSYADSYPPNAWPLVPVNPVVFVLPLDLEWTYTHLLARDIELPRPPAVSVNTITWQGWPDGDADDDDSPQSLTFGTDYSVDLSCDPGRIRLCTDVPWTNRASLTINFTAGYGNTPSSIPQPIVHAILLITANLYENRGDGDGMGMPTAAENLLWPYRMVSFA